MITTPDEIGETLFGADSKTEALIAEYEGKIAGYAVFFTSYSTRLGRNGIYMEDLYVSPDYRGKGAGRALLKHIAQLAVKRQCGRLEWSVLDWNQPAIDFYLSIGALPQSEWVRYRGWRSAAEICRVNGARCAEIPAVRDLCYNSINFINILLNTMSTAPSFVLSLPCQTALTNCCCTPAARPAPAR